MSFQTSIALQGLLEKPVHLALQGFLIGDLPIPLVSGVLADAKTAAVYSVGGDLRATIMVSGSASAVQVSMPVSAISVSDGRIEAFGVAAQAIVRDATPSMVIATAE